ncbi:bacterial Ig-like domain-containing protein [Enterococcus faecalis]|nr:bacterial Ig-like domain-containing protein [Enterococcus faecalis]MCD4945549.1 bacterial Ig-like domain-containing protein [Enterococcus faecalis]MDN3150222.1 bacterial Ig-like domain-containing protein [Enterococcus faecalis]MDN3158033.1 bacterial Ig-like domain-containing protein [Enterococcus faecalis]HCQ8740110.1 bacterial Ig-like domain-containing protein [Enterococcus faecalis]HCQ9317330.1 bacterial Ig-like domain-containing protein [Enterococcus faecalis]
MRKKFILLLFVLIFSIKQEEVVFSEIETVSTQAKIIESYDNTLRYGLHDMQIINPYYIDEGEVFNHIKVVLDATDEEGFKVPFSEIKYKWEDKALDTSKKGNTAVALLYWEKDPITTYRATIKVAYDLILQTQNSTIYQGEIWDPVTNFVRANDEDSDPVYWNDDRIKTNNASIDTNVPGVYYRRYTLKGQNKEQNKEVSSTFKVTVKEDQTKAELKDTELHVGQKWDLGSIFKNVVDKDGNPIKPEEIERVWIDDQETREIDTSKPGKHTVQIAVLKANNEWSYSNKVTVTIKDQTKAELKDTELYVGQKWDLGSVFKNVVDKDGNPIKPEEIKHVWIDDQETREIDTSKPGKHIVQIAVLKANNEWSYSNKVTVTIKEDQTKAELKDTELYVGQKWDLGSVFKNVVDKDGNPIKPEKVNYVWIDGNKTREIDTSKPGKHTVKIAILKANDEWVYSNEVTVKVKEDKTKAELKDTELYVGQKWGLGSVFKYAIDKDGNPIKLEQVPWVYIDGKQIDLRENKTKELIDTNKPGTHTVSIAIRNAADVGHAYEWAHSNEVTVTVKEEPFTIKQVPYFDFEDHILVSTNKSVVNKKEEPIIEVETPSINGKDWHLQVELSPFLDKKNSKSILKGVSLFIPKGKLESDLETEEPTQYDCQLEANGKASILMHGTKTKGKGRWKNKLETKGITLSIPSENKTGNYESTLHWTLLDVPG